MSLWLIQVLFVKVRQLDWVNVFLMLEQIFYIFAMQKVIQKTLHQSTGTKRTIKQRLCVEILQLRAKFQTAQASCSRVIWITNYRDWITKPTGICDPNRSPARQLSRLQVIYVGINKTAVRRCSSKQDFIKISQYPGENTCFGYSF